MSCNASYARFIFGKFFTSTIILYVLLFAQNFYSCKKVGVTPTAWGAHTILGPQEGGDLPEDGTLYVGKTKSKSQM
jgi:hypothetical protein